MPSKRVTATRVTEQVVIETHEDTLPGVAFAPGWTDALPDEVNMAQRDQQVNRCLQLLWLEASSMDTPPEVMLAIHNTIASSIGINPVSAKRLLPAPDGVKQAAATVLRAGPGATPKELILGGRRA